MGDWLQDLSLSKTLCSRQPLSVGATSRLEVGGVGVDGELGCGGATPPVSECGFGSDQRGYLDEGPLPFHAAVCSARPVSASLPPPAVRRVAPRFSIPPSSQEVMPGGSVNLTCVAVGAPMPYVKWMMGVEELTKEDEMPVGRNVLELSNVVRSANYTCVAISSLGMIEATAQVTVKGECGRCCDQYPPCHPGGPGGGRM